MPQSGRDLFSQLNVLWPDGLLTGTRDAFASEVENQFEIGSNPCRPIRIADPEGSSWTTTLSCGLPTRCLW